MVSFSIPSGNLGENFHWADHLILFWKISNFPTSFAQVKNSSAQSNFKWVGTSFSSFSCSLSPSKEASAENHTHTNRKLVWKGIERRATGQMHEHYSLYVLFSLNIWNWPLPGACYQAWLSNVMIQYGNRNISSEILYASLLPGCIFDCNRFLFF